MMGRRVWRNCEGGLWVGIVDVLLGLDWISYFDRA